MLTAKEEGESKAQSADYVYLNLELGSNCLHLSNNYATIVMLSALLLNHVSKVHQTEL